MVKTAIMPRIVYSALFAIPVLLLNPVENVRVSQSGLSIEFNAASAQDDSGSGRKTRRTMAVSESVNKKLAAVSQILNPEKEGAEPDLNLALREAKAINTSKWNEFEKAQLDNMMGGIYVQLERYPEAIKHYNNFIKTESVPEANQLNVMYYLAQLQLATENYSEAIRLLEDYIKRSEIVGADHYYKLGQAYYMAENLNKSLPNIDKAVELYETSDRIPPEGLFQYQMSLYHSKENYRKVITILEKMVRHYPKINHWRTLASMYGQAGRPKDQLHAYNAIYSMGGLQQDKELRLLASLYLENDYPYRAAKILAKGIKDNIVDKTSKNLELLGAAWSMSREQEKAIPVYEEAASKSDDGELYARLSQIYMADDDYKNAVSSARKALQRKLKRPENTQFNLGISLYNLNDFDGALQALREARKNKDMTQSANTWIRLVEGEKERVAKLAADNA